MPTPALAMRKSTPSGCACSTSFAASCDEGLTLKDQPGSDMTFALWQPSASHSSSQFGNHRDACSSIAGAKRLPFLSGITPLSRPGMCRGLPPQCNATQQAEAARIAACDAAAPHLHAGKDTRVHGHDGQRVRVLLQQLLKIAGRLGAADRRNRVRARSQDLPPQFAPDCVCSPDRCAGIKIPTQLRSAGFRCLAAARFHAR